MRRLSLTLAYLVVAACGGSGGGGGGDTPGDGSTTADAPPDMPATGGTFAITSPMLTEGAMFAVANTCNGADTSPQLDWTTPPANTKSYVVVMTDKTISLVHWVIYDIPAASTGLPANVEKAYAPTNVPGAHQTTSFQAATRGYLGPCPPPQGGAHTYELAIYAIDAAALPNATMNTTRQQAVMTAQQHMLGTAKLTGTFMR